MYVGDGLKVGIFIAHIALQFKIWFYFIKGILIIKKYEKGMSEGIKQAILYHLEKISCKDIFFLCSLNNCLMNVYISTLSLDSYTAN